MERFDPSSPFIDSFHNYDKRSLEIPAQKSMDSGLNRQKLQQYLRLINLSNKK